MTTSQRRRLNVLARHVTASQSFGAAAHIGAPVIIGGMVLDIQASPSLHCIKPGTTTPGEVRYVRGGVGRNVAECLAKLNVPPFLISIVGDDMAGDHLLAHWRSLGLSVDGIRRCVGASTPVVSAVFDRTGDLAAAVADTQAVEVHLTPTWIERFVIEIQAAPIVLLDANLHPLALLAACKLANDAGVPVWFEPVSVAKCVRACDLLKSMTYVSPNEAELLSMAEALHLKSSGSTSVTRKITKLKSIGAKCFSDVLNHELRAAVGEILEAGVKCVVLTLGSEGAVLCQMEPFGQILYYHYPAMPARVVKLSGAGDCLVAGTLAALSMNVVDVKAVAHGIAAAKYAVESDMNVPESLSWAEVTDSAKSVLNQTRTLVSLS